MEEFQRTNKGVVQQYHSLQDPYTKVIVFLYASNKQLEIKTKKFYTVYNSTPNIKSLRINAKT